jgi:hypothetical protein
MDSDRKILSKIFVGTVLVQYGTIFKERTIKRESHEIFSPVALPLPLLPPGLGPSL